jgi:hypothetical protein
MMAATPASSNFGRKLPDTQAGTLRPAFHGHLATLGIDADCDAARKGLAGFTDQRRVAHGERTQNDPGDTLVEPALDASQITNAATKLNRQGHRLEDFLDSVAIDRLAGERAVEVDQMQILEPLTLER